MTGTVKEHFLECHECGAPIFERDENYYTEDEEETCRECGVMHRIHVDEGDNEDDGAAYAHTDEHAEDIGQPHCLNECDRIYTKSKQCMDEFMDKPCRWNCEKTKAWVAAGGKLPVKQ